MLLSALIKSTRKDYKKIVIKGISFDSRKVKKGDIFFAIRGNTTSGVKFIDHALSRGALAIVSDTKINYKKNKVPFFLVSDVRKCLAEVCSIFFKRKPTNIIAVTGTNGKSSVADFFYQILNLNNINVASIGTLGLLTKKYNKKFNLTSIDPISLHKNLEILSKNKINNVILEASSHGLKQKRLDNLKIKIGVFTNLSHDHLDYHKNMKSYLNSKMYLFRRLLDKNSKIITDESNKEFKTINQIAKNRKIKKITIGDSVKGIRILQNEYKRNQQIVKILFNSKRITLNIPLIGYFQIKNLLMAALVALNSGINQRKVFEKIQQIKPVPGRLENIVSLNNNSNIILDFAHTPDALEQSLIALKQQFNKEILLVFGCGGERDIKKRFRMGKIAKKYCRKIFVTDDNPRKEDPKKIRKAILRGCKNSGIEIGNRKKAIEVAVNELKSNQILLVSGKGHETSQDYGDKIIKFSDKKIIKKIARKRNFFIKKNIKDFDLNNVNHTGVSINSKTIKKNNLFFAIKGKNTDGHKFVSEAIKRGAIKSVVSKRIKKISKRKIIKVRNTLSSLNYLAQVTRSGTLAKIVGITGSVGKTTLKNLIGFALTYYGRVYYSPHSYNNKFGVPLSLANLKKSSEFGIFEIGMDKKGEIETLSKMVRPEIGIITNVAEAHLKNFNSLKDIAKAKAEIISNISVNGHVILNKDDKFFSFFSNKAKSKKLNIISFSIKKKADISLIKIKKNKHYSVLKVRVKSEIFYFNTKIYTNAFISNFLACVSVLFVLNLNLKKMKNKFTGFILPNGRGDVKIVRKFKKNFKFIDESYNANPKSMKSAIQNMDYYKKNNDEKKLVFLGDMLELGKNSKKLHKELSKFINASSIDKVYVYGKYIKTTFNYLNKTKRGKVFNTLTEAHHYFNKIINNNDLLMVKGSNATGLNKFSKNIKKGQISAI